MIVIQSGEKVATGAMVLGLPDGPMASLVETTLAGRYHFWRGASDRRYTVSVTKVDPAAPEAGLPDFDGFVLLPVIRCGARCWPLAALAIERTLDRRAAITAALAEGASEWHVHLLGATRAARTAIVADLQARHFCGQQALSA